MFPHINKGKEMIKLRMFRLFVKMVWETHSSFRRLCKEGQIYIGDGKKEKYWDLKKYIKVFLLFVVSLVHN